MSFYSSKRFSVVYSTYIHIQTNKGHYLEQFYVIYTDLTKAEIKKKNTSTHVHITTPEYLSEIVKYQSDDILNHSNL